MKALWPYWLVTYAELTYWLVGSSPEEYHWAKANAWSRLDNHRRVIKHLQSYLKYSDNANLRWNLAYHLGCVEEWQRSADEYAKVVATMPQPIVRFGQAQAELRLGNRKKVFEIIISVDRDHPQLEENLRAMRDELIKECSSGG